MQKMSTAPDLEEFIGKSKFKPRPLHIIGRIE